MSTFNVVREYWEGFVPTRKQYKKARYKKALERYNNRQRKYFFTPI